MRRPFLIALTFLVGAAAGVGAAFLAWKPYGETALTRAIVRQCGTNRQLDGDARCTDRVTWALDSWFMYYYQGDR